MVVIGRTETFVPAALTTTTSGTVTNAYGYYEVSIANVGTANGVLLGATLNPGQTVTYRAPNVNQQIDDITYDATGTTFFITTLLSDQA